MLVAKPGLDGHDRGAKLVARALRDAGFEVIYTGIRQSRRRSPRSRCRRTSSSSGSPSSRGAHVGLTRKTVEALRAAGAGDSSVVVGGTIPRRDVERLEAAGAAAVFPTGTPLEELVDSLRALSGAAPAPS